MFFVQTPQGNAPMILVCDQSVTVGAKESAENTLGIASQFDDSLGTDPTPEMAPFPASQILETLKSNDIPNEKA